jgi:anaerobic magnesium-protoporphyrin IX monomethyl ester cyclase
MNSGKNVIILFFPSPHPENSYTNFPWALLYLERMVRHLDIEIILLDERLDKNIEEILIQHKDKLLFAGVSAILGYQVVGGIKFSKSVKSQTNAPIIWGGWFPTIFSEMILNDNHTDYICVGQGEIPFKSFTEKMLSGESLSEIPGIGYKKDGKIFINPHQGLIDPFQFPEIDKTLIDLNRLIDLNGKVAPELRSIDYIATFGCPYKCSFCNLTNVAGSKWYTKATSDIISDLKYFKEKAGVSHIIFIDDNFLISKKHILAFCTELILSGLSFTWQAHAHVGYFLKHFSDYEIRLLYKSGCRRIVIGAESGDQEVLDLLNKKTTVSENLAIVKKLRQHHIITRMHTMVCFPLNPDKDFFLTLNMIGKAILIDQKVEANIKFYKPVPKTELFQLCVENGFVQPKTIDELLAYFSTYIAAPWYKRNYHKDLDYFANFYILFAKPNHFMTFPIKYRPIIFILTIFFFPVIYLRFKLNLRKFPIGGIIFRKLFPHGKISTYLDSVSVNKSKNTKY